MPPGPADGGPDLYLCHVKNGIFTSPPEWLKIYVSAAGLQEMEAAFFALQMIRESMLCLIAFR